MPFGVVGLLGTRIIQVDGMEITPREGAILGVNVEHPIVTNGDSVA